MNMWTGHVDGSRGRVTWMGQMNMWTGHVDGSRGRVTWTGHVDGADGPMMSIEGQIEVIWGAILSKSHFALGSVFEHSQCICCHNDISNRNYL